MAAQYFGVGGVARKVKGQFVGVNGVARKVKNGYVGVSGVARRFFESADPDLSKNTWEQIADASASGTAKTLWTVGDEIDITLTTGDPMTLVILDFDHDDLASGGKAGLTFGMKHLLDGRQMEANGWNSDSFIGTSLYTWLTDTLFGQLPADLRAVIKAVKKTTSAGNKKTTLQSDAMQLFLFSEVEVFGRISYSVAGEGSQYSYFTDTATRTKRTNNGAGSQLSWWLRSPYKDSSSDFCNCVTGIPNYLNAVRYSGVCFGFCV